MFQFVLQFENGGLLNDSAKSSNYVRVFLSITAPVLFVLRGLDVGLFNDVTTVRSEHNAHAFHRI
jgi:hypothetical protein